jgi:hypothetical protein
MEASIMPTIGLSATLDMSFRRPRQGAVRSINRQVARSKSPSVEFDVRGIPKIGSAASACDF